MAQTYTIAEALTIVAPQIGRRIEDGTATYLANLAQFKIWNAYDWRETITLLPPFWLIPNEQDYGPPSAIIPTNFLGLREAYIVNASVWPAARFEMKVRRDLRTTHVQAMPREIAYEPTAKRFRVFARVPAGIGSTDWAVDGTYKIRPPKITAANLQTTVIPWDDQYLSVFLAALKWAAWDTAGDQRALNQMAIMHDEISKMAGDEGLNLGDPVLAPSEPLVYPNTYFGNYGLLF